MPKSKMQLRSFMQNRVRSHSQDLSTSYILDSDMSCNETLQDLRFLNKNFQQPEQLNEEQCTCQCAKCMSSAKNEQTEQLDAEQKKRLKRRQYKKRQKAKAQQKKQFAQQELGFIVTDIYELRTTYKESKPAIQECLNALEKNIQKFYDLVNTIIKEQVEKIKKQLASCLNAISSNLTPEERLHEIKILSFVIEQIIEASPQLEMIINHFIKMMSQKDNEQHRYQKDLDRKTLRFLLLDDSKNRTNFLAVVKWMEKGCCTEEEKMIIEDVIAIVREKNVFAECSSCGKGKENIEECESQHQEKEMEEYEEEPDQLLEQYNGVENVTKSSERDEEFSYSDDDQQEQTSGQKTNKKRHTSRKRKTKNIKIYEPSYERTYETLVQLQQSLNSKKIEKLNCNVDEDWTERFRKKFLKKSLQSK